jgi:polar amino acid transport system substrate-binding protein
MIRVAIMPIVAAILTACSTPSMTPKAPPAVVTELAPTGKLRAVINLGNPMLAGKDAATGEPRGVSVELKRAQIVRVPTSEIEDMKASGFVAGALARHGIEGATVAPAAGGS